jgi:hypothetical protein
MVTPRAGPSSWVHLVLTSFIYNIYLYNGQREKSFFVIFFYLSLCCSREEIENKSSVFLTHLLLIRGDLEPMTILLLNILSVATDQIYTNPLSNQ